MWSEWQEKLKLIKRKQMDWETALELTHKIEIMLKIYPSHQDQKVRSHISLDNGIQVFFKLEVNSSAVFPNPSAFV